MQGGSLMTALMVEDGPQIIGDANTYMYVLKDVVY